MASRLLSRFPKKFAARNDPIRRLPIEGTSFGYRQTLRQPIIASTLFQQFGISTSAPHQPTMVANQQGVRQFSTYKLQSALEFRRSFSAGTSTLPVISDPDIKAACKELMACYWDEIPNSVIRDVKKALAKNTEDKSGQEALSNIFRAAEASVEFSAILVNIRFALEERTGMTGENVDELPEELVNAITVAYNRYIAYVNSFGPDETYLRKKIEAELGTRLIHLKQRVSGLGSEWGDINVIGTSGLSGSYVEQRS